MSKIRTLTLVAEFPVSVQVVKMIDESPPLTYATPPDCEKKKKRKKQEEEKDNVRVSAVCGDCQKQEKVELTTA